jgi:hypothetical protein
VLKRTLILAQQQTLTIQAKAESVIKGVEGKHVAYQNNKKTTKFGKLS